MSRYSGRRTFFNDQDFYSNVFEEREVNGIRQYSTPVLRHPDDDQLRSLNTIPHVWKTGDKLFKLAHDHYGDSTKWWVIAWFNQKPTESDLTLGDILHIPHPLDRVLTYLGS
jgi:hypothetical protein